MPESGTLTKAHIVGAVAEANGITRQKLIETVEMLLELIKSTLESGEDVLISGFGKFSVKQKDRDIEKGYTTKQMVAKLRRLADCLENGKQFKIQIAGERIQIPSKALFNIEHEREGNTEEVEFQFKWES